MSQTFSLTDAEQRSLACVAAMMIPASAEYGVPGADDPIILADMVATIGRDGPMVRTALARLDSLAGGPFADASPAQQQAAAETFRSERGEPLATISRVILQCYYRDDRVLLALDIEPRPPFPKGHTLEQGDWSLLDPVRKRPKMWRDAPP